MKVLIHVLNAHFWFLLLQIAAIIRTEPAPAEPLKFESNTELYQKCDIQYPKLDIQAAFSKPYTGIYVVHMPEDGKSLYVGYLEKPRGLSFQARTIHRVKKIKNNLSGRAIKKGDIVFAKDFEFHILRDKELTSFTTLDGESTTTTLEDNHIYVNKDIKAIFQLHGLKRDYMVLVYECDEQTCIGLYNSETLKRIHKIELKFSNQFEKEQELRGMVPFDYLAKDGPRMGVMFFDKFHRNFQLDVTNEKLKISLGPFQANQVLLGCPQTFCFDASVDAIEWDKKTNKTALIQRSYYWQLDNLEDEFKDLRRLSTVNTQDDLNPYLLPPIDAAAQADNFYIFRGSRLYYKPLNENVTTYFWKPALRLFNETDYRYWINGIDAAVMVPHVEDAMVLFKGDTYIITEFQGINYTNSKTGHLSDFTGYPEHVEAVLFHPDTESLYTFSGNWVYVHKVSPGEKFPPTSDPQQRLFKDLFGLCRDYKYEKTAYKSSQGFEDMNVPLESLKVIHEANNRWVLQMLCIMVAVVLTISLLGITVHAIVAGKKKQRITDKAIKSIRMESDSLTIKRSGFSVTGSLKEIVETRRRNQPMKTKEASPGSTLKTNKSKV